MALKKTVHGEKLEERVRFSGVKTKSSFRVREVYCPRCGAKPHRKCHWRANELQGDFCVWTVRWWGRMPAEAAREAKLRGRRGYDHDERRGRAEALSGLAQRGRARVGAPAALPSLDLPASTALPPGRDRRKDPLFQLAVRDPVEKRRVLEHFDRLPLFEGAPDEDGAESIDAPCPAPPRSTP